MASLAILDQTRIEGRMNKWEVGIAAVLVVFAFVLGQFSGGEYACKQHELLLAVANNVAGAAIIHAACEPGK